MMQTAGTDAALTPHGLSKIFMGFPLSRVPVVHGLQIVSFLSKAKMLRLSGDGQFFGSDILNVLPSLLSDEAESLFFEELDSLEEPPTAIPVFQGESLSVQLLTLRDFNARYRPLETIPADFQDQVLNELPLPVMVFNPRRFCVFRNKRCTVLKKALVQAGLGGRNQPLEECLPEPFFTTLQNPDPSTVYQLKNGASAFLSWKVARMDFPRGVLYAVTFLHAEGQRL